MPVETFKNSYIGPRDFASMQAMTAEDCADLQTINKMGFALDERVLTDMVDGIGMDAIQNLGTTASIGTPIQFLQYIAAGHVNQMFRARKIDELVGRDVMGAVSDEEIVQSRLEMTSKAVPYGDYTNTPFSSWNQNWERRSIVRFETGMRVSWLEDMRSAAVRVDNASTKRAAALLGLDIQRNAIGFVGFNSGANRTYGFLNDPSLPAYVTVANGAAGTPTWATKTYDEIVADLQVWFKALVVNSGDNINPETDATTLALPTGFQNFLTKPNSLGKTAKEWLRDNFPMCRIVSAPELTGANGGANVAYLYAEKVNDGSTDGGSVFTQMVQSVFQVVGVEKLAKGYQEAYVNASAGVMCKRGFAVYRASGI